MGTIYEQARGDTNVEAGLSKKNLIKEGKLVDIEAEAAGREIGSTIAGYGKLKNYLITRGEGDSATITYFCEVDTSKDVGTQDVADKTDWSLSQTRIELPIEALCGESPGQDPQLWFIERWRQEKDYTLYNAYKFYVKNVEYSLITDANAKTQTMARMIRSGVDYFVRFFPLVTRIEEYKKQPTLTKKLGEINTPPKWEELCDAWLKVQEDITSSDGKWYKTESWQGADFYWTEIYGAASSRWKIGGYKG